MLRKVLLAAATTAALAAPALAETTASVGVEYMSTEYDNTYNYDTWSLNGSVFHRVSGPWAVQAQGRLEAADYPSNFEDDGNVWGVHGLYQTDAWTLGIVAGQGGLFSNDDELRFWGVEGAYRFANWTLSGYALNGDYYTSDESRYGIDGRYYITDNLALGGGFARQDHYTAEFDAWNVTGEWRLDALPITFTGRYYNWENGLGWGTDDWTLGARWEFGSANLREHDRTAPIANITDLLDDIRRWD